MVGMAKRDCTSGGARSDRLEELLGHHPCLFEDAVQGPNGELPVERNGAPDGAYSGLLAEDHMASALSDGLETQTLEGTDGLAPGESRQPSQ